MTGLSCCGPTLEPVAGALVPRSAFSAPAAEAAFLEAVRGHMAAAKASQA